MSHLTFSPGHQMSSEAKPSFKRDFLKQIETTIQQKWDAEHINEVDAPSASENPQEKFMVTFPYPYMNGRLHLGHSFTLTKAEFAVRYQRMLGKRALFPLAYHCTGMPIKAAADKIRNEIEKFGNPPVFPESEASSTDSSKQQHSKVAAKSGSAKYQWQIMEAMGIPREDIAKFADPAFWMVYFPPMAAQDTKALGLAIDHRRSFISTDKNPFYDAFIRWQFNKLRRLDRIKFGKRHTVYSPLDGQACLDHDRQSGEGVEPKEYTAIKLRLLSLPTCLSLPEDCKAVYLLAATLRPETMYGQTNVWVGPDIEYGVYRSEKEGEVYVCTARAARNLAYQDGTPANGVVELLGKIRGTDLIGLPVSGPLSVYERIYVLPMFGVSASKGTGIVTSVPSNAPADYAALRDLVEKEALRAKFGIREDQVVPFKPVSVVKTEALGELPAEKVVLSMGIRSQNDAVALEQAKETVYKEDFYSGVMNAGPYRDQPVSQVKDLIRRELIAAGQAREYFEPENVVISRSGDECVVALVDQWFIDYGEAGWRADAEKCLALMDVPEETRHQFQRTLEWMRQWACSRSFGLGTRLPWDPQYLIESLSDSTVYMAFYTVAHILHEGSYDGSTSPHGVKPEQMTDEVWEWIFADPEAKDPPFPSVGIPMDLLERMRREFRYFYPWDLRVSGKDLVPNHLTMSIYNHVALFSPAFWPRGVRANGHLLLNSEKMSKSTGNFMTVSEAVAEFGADATRLALADAGDSVEDANFLKDTANAAILRLYTLLEFFQTVLAGNLREETNEAIFADRVFLTQMNRAVGLAQAAYQNGAYRDAVKYGFFELQNARDQYRDATSLHGNVGMSKALLKRFAHVQALLLLPICPHFAEHVWQNVLGNNSSILYETFPQAGPIDAVLLEEAKYLQDLTHTIRTNLAAERNPRKKKSATTNTTADLNAAEIYVASGYPKWEEDAIEILRRLYDPATGRFASDQEISAAMKLVLAGLTGKTAKRLMPFVMELRNRVLQQGPSAFDRVMQFDEYAVLEENLDYLTRSLGFLSISLRKVEGGEAGEEAVARVAEAAVPGAPAARFFSV